METGTGKIGDGAQKVGAAATIVTHGDAILPVGSDEVRQSVGVDIDKLQMVAVYTAPIGTAVNSNFYIETALRNSDCDAEVEVFTVRYRG